MYSEVWEISIKNVVLTAFIFHFAGLGVVRVFLEVHWTRHIVVYPETDFKELYQKLKEE